MLTWATTTMLASLGGYNGTLVFLSIGGDVAIALGVAFACAVFKQGWPGK